MEQQKSVTIFINPKFKNAYINPNFLKISSNAQPAQIHFNPKFLQKPSQLPSLQNQGQSSSSLDDSSAITQTNRIIKNTKRSLIRAAPVSTESTTTTKLTKDPVKESAKSNVSNLIKISNTKLIKASHLMEYQQKENEAIKNSTKSLIKSKALATKKKIEDSTSIYKLDRRKLNSGFIEKRKKKRVVSTYSIRRVDVSDMLTPKKTLVESRALPSNATLEAGGERGGKVVMLNINGVLYKSTSKKLRKTTGQKAESNMLMPQSSRLLVVRGQKFSLDSSGKKLKRDNGKVAMSLSRIDIGGLTYKKTSSSDSYECDNSHQVRSHLTQAKTKSISVLQRSLSQKTSNTICPIYRRIGKCLAYAKGKCFHVHDPRYVIVCPKFLKGICRDEKCLLSHNANLHKMPVCKYYLQGACAKSKPDCLYLHKKVTEGTKLCPEFVKGYCPLAEECNLLHDNIDAENKKKYCLVRRKNTPSKKTLKQVRVITAPSIPPKGSMEQRYFEVESSSPAVVKNIPKFSKTAAFLPDFVKL